MTKQKVRNKTKVPTTTTTKTQRGLGGIEPPTSPTLKENHTTRPKAHGILVAKP